MRALAVLVVLSFLACPLPPGPDDGEVDAGLIDGGAVETPDAGSLDGGIDAGLFDGGSPDAGVADSGATDAGGFDAGATDAGVSDGGVDAGRLPPVPLVPADASIAIEDAGYAWVDLTGRVALNTTLRHVLDGGFVVAVSTQSLVVAEGPACQLSFVNSYACDYSWLTADGGVLSTVSLAYGGVSERGDVMMLFRAQRTDCPDPTIPNRSLQSALTQLMDVETGATRLSWPRTELSALPYLLPKGDLVREPGIGRSCDAGSFAVNSLATYTRVRSPYQQFTGVAGFELGDDRLLLLDAGNAVTRIEADGGQSRVLGNGPYTWLNVERDTYTVRRGDKYLRGAIDGGALLPVGTLTPMDQLGFQGGRFASVTEVPDYAHRRIIDTLGVVPELQYATSGYLLQRAPLLVGVDPAGQVLVARVDLGTASTLPVLTSQSITRWQNFPDDDALLFIDRNKVAWMIETSGVKRVAEDARTVSFRSFDAPVGSPNVVLVTRGPTGGPYELSVVDRTTQRVAVLSSNLALTPSLSYLGACDVPGLLGREGRFIYFAEPSVIPGALELFLVRSDLTTVPRHVGTTLASRCTAPVVSADGSLVAVQETLGGAVTVSVGAW